MSDQVTIEKGADRTLELVVRRSNGLGEPISVQCTVSVLAGVTSIPIAPLEDALANGDMLIKKDSHGLVLAVNGAHAVGVTTLTVLASGFPVNRADVFELLQDLTGYTIKMEVLERAGDATPVIADTALSVSIPSQATAANRGRVQITVDAADTASITAKPYKGEVWRRDAGNTRRLWTGDVPVVEEGFT